MKTPLVSIICTTKRNSIENLSRCLAQLISQNLKNIEILVIDDGFSMEDTDTIEKMCSLDPRIRVIYRYKHSGPGAARNLGIRRARGTFVTFVDFDDCLSDMFCWIMTDMIIDFNAEIAICGILKEAGDVPDVGTFVAKYPLIDNEEKGDEFGASIINKGMPGVSFDIEGINIPGAKLFRRDFLLDCPWLLFPEKTDEEEEIVPPQVSGAKGAPAPAPVKKKTEGESDGTVFLLKALAAGPIVLMVDVPLYTITKVSAKHKRNPGNDPDFVEHEIERLRELDRETGDDPLLAKATAREALCSLLRIEYSLKNTKVIDAKDYLKKILEMQEFVDALKLLDELGFKSRDQYLLNLSRQKKVVNILKEVTRKNVI